MKLLTLNTHSIIDESYDDKIKVFCEAIIKYEPDVIALQEVMQPIAGEKAEKDDLLKGVGRIPVKSGNFAYNVLKRLKKHNSNYHGVYFGIKKAYDKYDEGLAILSNKEINTTEITQLTKFNDYNNWKTRFSLGAGHQNRPCGAPSGTGPSPAPPGRGTPCDFAGPPSVS